MTSSKTTKYAKLIAISFAIVELFFVLMTKIDVGEFPEIKNNSFVYVVADNDSSSNIGVEQFNDFAPMFIPTQWNSSVKKQELQKTSAWQSTNETFAKKSEETNVAKDILLLERKKTHRQKQLDIIMRSAFISFGAEKTKIASVKNPLVLEIKNIDSGKIVFEKKLSKKDIGDFINIAEFSIRVSDNIMQMPLLKLSSGDIEIDKKLRGVILQNHTSLPNGEFRATFIP